MDTAKKLLFIGVLCSVIGVTLFSGCSKAGDPISEANKADKTSGITAPSIDETKAIAEEAFIYGLPIVMNYAVMNEYCVDKNSGQYKAPFNTMYNEARR